MITDLTNKDVWESKRNWIDQNNVVFGYDNVANCCEEWGWGVFNPKTCERVAEDPSDLPYHFDFSRGATTLHFENDERHKSFCKMESDYVDQLDIVRVYLLHDNGTDDELMLEAYTDHNGWYLHDFSFEKMEAK